MGGPFPPTSRMSAPKSLRSQSSTKIESDRFRHCFVALESLVPVLLCLVAHSRPRGSVGAQEMTVQSTTKHSPAVSKRIVGGGDCRRGCPKSGTRSKPKKWPPDFTYSSTVSSPFNRILDDIVPLLFPTMFRACTIFRLLWWWLNAASTGHSWIMKCASFARPGRRPTEPRPVRLQKSPWARGP